MFTERVEKEDGSVPRFSRIDEKRRRRLAGEREALFSRAEQYGLFSYGMRLDGHRVEHAYR
jgi:hypothetical protein